MTLAKVVALNVAMLGALISIGLIGWWGFAIFLALVALSFFWPRCPSCRMRVFYNKRPTDPDHFIYRLANWPMHSACGRCGESLLSR
jgi:hypothetical protein